MPVKVDRNTGAPEIKDVTSKKEEEASELLIPKDIDVEESDWGKVFPSGEWCVCRVR